MTFSAAQAAPSPAKRRVVVALGLLNAAMSLISIPIQKGGSALTGLPIISSLEWEAKQSLTLWIWAGTVVISILASVAYVVIAWRDRGNGRRTSLGFAPFIWTAIINAGVIGAVYAAVKLH